MPKLVHCPRNPHIGYPKNSSYDDRVSGSALRGQFGLGVAGGQSLGGALGAQNP